ncbi:MAG TPA: hypothetical protein VIL20_21170 [Sandaracinaceae bacterium]
MARALATAALVALLCAAPATAQQDAGAPALRVRVVRPPEGSMRRGILPVPDWAVYAAGGLLAAVAAGVLAWRTSTRRR